MTAFQKITPCLWFDSEAEEAARFYVAVFRNARIGRISRYGKEGFEIHGRPEGSVMTVEFELAGQSFTALNGGPHFKFNEAISLQIPCETQEEIDHYRRLQLDRSDFDREQRVLSGNCEDGRRSAVLLCQRLSDRRGGRDLLRPAFGTQRPSLRTARISQL
jgi:predicted 3-demethylubiquinone-9 3-methyltransferase (glyoxalase superfamily)